MSCALVSTQGFEEAQAEAETSCPTDSSPVPANGENREKLADVELGAPKKKKKKKKKSKKPKSKRGLNKPTGFEEYYVDTPITPEEFEKEKELYNVSRPIVHRMEDAIVRYLKNRRLLNERHAVFMKYLAYGGVNISQKMFQGVEDRDMKDMDAEDVLTARGQATIDYDRSHLAIDFNAVVKGFLTSVFPFFFNPESEAEAKLATDTIRNFLSYLLYHDVCPEYTQNIDDARRSCDIAAKEIWKNVRFTAQGPGHFNTAASTLFGGFYHDNYVEGNRWENKKGESIFMTTEVASKVLKFALAGAGSYMQVKRYDELATAESLEAVCVEDIHGFEVIRVDPPSAQIREFYKEHAPDLYPVGKIYGKAYRDPGKPRYDLGPEDRLKWEQYSASAEEFEFFAEEHLLEHCYPGMKVMATVWELNGGFHFFDEVFSAYCSHYTVLANDLMMGWKKPRDLTGEGADDSNDEDS